MEPKLSHKLYEGPWQVAMEHPTDSKNWYIYNTVTRRYKKVGPVGGKVVNYCHRAHLLAQGRNRQVAEGK